MSNAVTKLEASVPATQPPAPPVTQEILSTDITLPRLLLMQGLSEFVKNRKAQMGDIVRSTTLEAVADPSGGIDFIPLKVVTNWAEKEKIGQKFEFRRSFPRTTQNEHLPWNFWRNPSGQEFDKPGMMGATEWQRVKGIDVYALLPEDVDAFEEEMKKADESGELPELTKTILPVVISFRSTSFNAGKTVTTFYAQLAEMAQRIPSVRPYKYKLTLGCEESSNAKGDFFIFTVSQAKKADAKYWLEAERWLAKLNTAQVTVDPTGDSEDAVSGQY